MARSAAVRLEVLPGGAGKLEPSTVSDEAIIEAFATGDRRRAELLYDRLIRVVDVALYRVLGRREDDHDDLVQATFEQVVSTLTRRRFAGGCTLAGWASTIACHVALNSIRSRSRERRVLDRRCDPEIEGAKLLEPVDVEVQVGARRSVEALRRHLGEMDEAKATTVVVHDVLGHSLAEIATMMGVSVSAAQTRLVRGRKDLRRRMNEEIGGAEHRP